MSWFANGAVAVAYLAIAWAIMIRVLLHDRQWRENPLALATALIFFSCGIGHGLHVVHLVQLGDTAAGRAHAAPVIAWWDLGTAAIAFWYWTMRSRVSALRGPGALFEDVRLVEQAKLGEALDALPQVVMIADVVRDASGEPVDLVMRRANAYTQRQERASHPSELNGKHFSATFPAVVRVGMLEKYLTVARTGTPLDEHVEWFEGVTTRGSFDVTCVPYDNGVLISVRDVTGRALAERERDAARREVATTFAVAPVGICVLDRSGQFRSVNPQLCQLLGYDETELLAVDPATLLASDLSSELRPSPLSQTMEQELRLRCKDGHEVWVHAVGRVVDDGAGTPGRVVSVVADITERKRFEAALQHQAVHDQLTGLLNRRGFLAELDRHVAVVRRYGPRGALLVLDLDGFKLVNDTLGHPAGDQLIVSVAELIRRSVRDTDIVARLGGDEFAVIFPEADREHVEEATDRILDAIREHASTFDGTRSLCVTASGGLAMFDSDEVTAPAILALADATLYDAKDAGRDQVHLTGASHRVPRTQARVRWLQRIRGALDGDGFALFTQRIVHAHTREVTSHELLLRLPLEDGTLAQPGHFLYVAEQHDLIVEVDAWVLEKAIDLLAHPHAFDAGLESVLAVNVSGRSMGDPRIVQAISSGLARTGVAANRLVIEVTETAAVANVLQARAFLDHLRGLGVRVAIDDFGAGFGSFYYAKHLPFDLLKLDGEFVVSCLDNPTDRSIVEAVTTLARGIGKDVVAEHVTDEAVAVFLAGMGVRYLQGYLFGQPEPIVVSLDGVAAVGLPRPRRSFAPARAEDVPSGR